MIELKQLRALQAVATRRSFAAAAKALGLARSTVARRVDELERDLGIRLVEATPQGVRLTSAGEQLAAEGASLVRGARRLEERLQRQTEAPGGVVRFAISTGTHEVLVLHGLGLLLAQHPDLRVEVRLVRDPVALMAQWADIALVIGDLPDTGAYLARSAIRMPFRLLASAAYLDGAPPLASVDDLDRHDLYLPEIGTHGGTSLPLWDGGQVPVEPRLSSPNFRLVRLAASQGRGLAFGPTPAFDVADGDVVAVLEDRVGADVPTWVVTHAGTVRSANVGAVIEAIASAVGVATATLDGGAGEE